MKKTIFIICLMISLTSCKAQVLPLNTLMENIPPNAYVKDLNNELSPFVGVYKSIHQGKEITLYITKVNDRLTKRYNKQFYRDALIVKYTVKNTSGDTLQDTQFANTPNIFIYSTKTDPSKNLVIFSYSGTYCNVGWGSIYLKKLNPTQLSWDYRPNSSNVDDCPEGTDTTIYLPDVDNLIFTKQ